MQTLEHRMAIGSSHASPLCFLPQPSPELYFITVVRHQTSTAYEIFFNFVFLINKNKKIFSEFSVDSESCSTFTLKIYYLEALSVHFSVGIHFLGCFRVFMFISFTPSELIGSLFLWVCFYLLPFFRRSCLFSLISLLLTSPMTLLTSSLWCRRCRHCRTSSLCKFIRDHRVKSNPYEKNSSQNSSDRGGTGVAIMEDVIGSVEEELVDKMEEEEEGGGWDDWGSDGEGLEPEFKCLFCTLTWRSAGDLSRQCSSIHSFDF